MECAVDLERVSSCDGARKQRKGTSSSNGTDAKNNRGGQGLAART